MLLIIPGVARQIEDPNSQFLSALGAFLVILLGWGVAFLTVPSSAAMLPELELLSTRKGKLGDCAQRIWMWISGGQRDRRSSKSPFLFLWRLVKRERCFLRVHKLRDASAAGTSIGPFITVAPFFFARAIADSRSGTSA